MSDASGRRGGLRGVASNVASLFGAKVVDRATNFVVYALVARSLGATGLGRLTLAISLLQLFVRFTALGLQTLTTREVAKSEETSAAHAAHAGLAVLAASLLAQPLVWGFVELMGYEEATAGTIRLLFLGLVPYSLMQVSQAVFIGWEKAHLTAAVNTPVYLVQTVAVFLLLEAGADARTVAMSFVVAYSVIASVEWLVLRVRAGRFGRLSPASSVRMVRQAAPFLGIQGTNAIGTNVNVIVLSRLLGEAAVGIYSAANQLLVPLNLILNATASGVFPLMVRRFERGVRSLRQAVRYVLEATAAVALPAVTGLFVLAAPLLLLVYGEREFLASVDIARIMVLLPLEVAFTSILGQILWATDHERKALRVAVVNTLAKVAGAIALIPLLGVRGAALASLVVGILNLVQHYVPVARILGGLEPITVLWRPGVATAVMAAVVAAVDTIGVLGRVGLGVGVYAAALAALLLLGGQGIPELLARFRTQS